MSIAGYNTMVSTAIFETSAADQVRALVKAPGVGLTILNAYIHPQSTFDADGSNHVAFSLLDGGTAGTGTTAIATYGGASVDYTANTAVAMTVSADSVDGGDWILAKLESTGTTDLGAVTVQIEWTHGGT